MKKNRVWCVYNQNAQKAFFPNLVMAVVYMISMIQKHEVTVMATAGCYLNLLACGSVPPPPYRSSRLLLTSTNESERERRYTVGVPLIKLTSEPLYNHAHKAHGIRPLSMTRCFFIGWKKPVNYFLGWGGVTTRRCLRIIGTIIMPAVESKTRPANHLGKSRREKSYSMRPATLSMVILFIIHQPIWALVAVRTHLGLYHPYSKVQG